jgi:serine protease Do
MEDYGPLMSNSAFGETDMGTIQSEETPLGEQRCSGRIRALVFGIFMSLSVFCFALQMAAANDLTPSLFTNGDSVRRAFAEVVTDARLWTVKIQSAGVDAALGVVVASDGLILTKASAVEAGNITCQLHDGRVLPATVFAVQDRNDLALLKVKADQLATVKWATDTDPHVGQWVVTPSLGELPVAIGVVSVERREIPQTRAPGTLDIELQSTNGELQIVKVTPGSRAIRAGLLEADIIKRIGDRTFDSSASLFQHLQQRQAGDAVDVVVQRGQAMLSISTRLDYFTVVHPDGDRNRPFSPS